MFTKSLFNSMSKRTFSSLTQYANGGSKVFLSVSQGGNKMGDMVFELYDNHQPNTVENFKALADGQLNGDISSGMAGLGVHVGENEEGESAFGVRLPDEDMSVRHVRRGQLSMASDGTNANGSKVLITFGEAEYLNGYNTCFGEIVSGHDVLDKLEEATNRHGQVGGDFSISASGSH